LSDGEIAGCREGIEHCGQSSIEHPVQTEHIDLHGFIDIKLSAASKATSHLVATSTSRMAFLNIEQSPRRSYLAHALRF